MRDIEDRARSVEPHLRTLDLECAVALLHRHPAKLRERPREVVGVVGTQRPVDVGAPLLESGDHQRAQRGGLAARNTRLERGRSDLFDVRYLADWVVRRQASRRLPQPSLSA